MNYRGDKKPTGRIIAAVLFLIFFVPLVIFGLKIISDENKQKTDIFGDPVSELTNDVKSSDKNADQKELDRRTKEDITAISSILPKEVIINVPYTRQAPFSVWDDLHEDACEEASLLMVKHFIDGIKISSKQSIENEIVDLVNFEKENGYGLSITLDQLNKIAYEKYGMNGKVVKNITVDEIRRELANGNPVIVGAAGKILPNPYFRNGGPVYHMLVIKGYDDKDFITNDPGTMKGDGFKYSFNDLINAIHDWDPHNIMNGQKNYLVFN